MNAPPAAVVVFGDRIAQAEQFADWLTGPGIARGLLGPREADQIWQRHVLNGVGIAALIEPGSVVIDIGSGAGLPGVPLLLARPDLQMVLVEPKARRAEFLAEMCADLDLPARVVRARATADGLIRLPEGTTGDPIPAAEVVTARAVASLADLARWAVPLLRQGGQLLAVKGTSAGAELDRDRSVLDDLGFAEVQIRKVQTPPIACDGAGSAVAATVVAMRLGRVSRET